MIQRLRTLQWNIGGGKIRTMPHGSSYDQDGLAFIEQFIKEQAPDIVTLQETHSKNGHTQAEILARSLEWTAFTNDVYAHSHLEDGQGLGQAILSRFPITTHRFSLLPAPNLRLVLPGGHEAPIHDKGVTFCTVELSPQQYMNVATLHLFPFRKLKADAFNLEFAPIRAALTDLATPTEPLWVFQGDFNVNESSLRNYLPDLFAHGIDEFVLPEPTTPRGGLYDHVLFKTLCLTSGRIIKDVPTDHYPIVCDFEIS